MEDTLLILTENIYTHLSNTSYLLDYISTLNVKKKTYWKKQDNHVYIKSL